MLAIAIIIGVVYFALNYAEKNPPYEKNKRSLDSNRCSYKENERPDLQVR